ncbi:MAG: hypothetical protein FWC22_05085 [Treponema sp.]|nr:hypothetical protein [Treponema sp.]
MKFTANKKIFFAFTAAAVFILNSCIGLSMDIQLNKNGSGKLIMEYRISNTLIDLGAVDGNKNWPTIPVGRQDWERTIRRIDGAKLSSFSTNKTGQDTFIKVTIDFNNPDALLKIIDSAGGNSSLNMSGQLLSINLFDSPKDDISEYDDFIGMTGHMFEGYNFSISFGAWENSTLKITNQNGGAFNPPASAKIVNEGKKTSFSMEMKDLLNLSDNIELRFNW